MSDACEFCVKPGPVWSVYCDDCCVRKVLEMPDRERRRQVLVTVRMRRGKAAEARIRAAVEKAWKGA